MRKTINNIVTSGDIQRINEYITQWNDTEATDPEMALLRDIVLDIRNYDIPMQMVVYTLLQNEMDVIAVSKKLNVTKTVIYNYLHKWQRNVMEKFKGQHKKYEEWLDEVHENNNSTMFYRMIICDEEE